MTTEEKSHLQWDGAAQAPDKELPAAEGGEEYHDKHHGKEAPKRQEQPALVHESSFVDQGAVLGKGTRVWHFCHVQQGAVIGENCVLGQNVNIGPNVTVGNGVKIQNNVSVYQGVTLEDDVFCGPSVVFTNDIAPRSPYPKGAQQYKKTLVRQGASLGANATILCGITIGKWAMIGAGAVVSGSVPDHGLMVGVPARQQGWVCRCGRSLSQNLRCPVCGRQYLPGPHGLLEKEREGNLHHGI